MELKRELPALEKEIAELEKLKTRNQELLCDPEVLKDSKRIKPLMQELNAATTRLAELYRRWEELTRRTGKSRQNGFMMSSEHLKNIIILR